MSRSAFSGFLALFGLGLLGLMREIDLHHTWFATISGAIAIVGLIGLYRTWPKSGPKGP